MVELAFQSATQLLESIRKRRISSVELLELYNERYKRLNPRINAIVTTDFESARIRAKEADKAMASGKSWGPLHGLPMTIKDSIEVVGMPCTAGSPNLKNHMPTRNADVVQPLIDAGAIVFGKTNLSLFAGDFQCFNDLYGQTNNPWDPTQTSGGSSGGSAVALAAGLTGLEIGSDLGGSIRVPAHFCGIYGHKPSYGIVPLRGNGPPPPGVFTGTYSLESDIAVTGPMARSAKDLDLAMDLIVRPSLHQQKAIRIELPKPRKSALQDYRVGLWLDDPVCPVDSNVADRIQWIADELAKAGARVEDKHPDIDFADCLEIYAQMANATTSAGHSPDLFGRLIDMASTLNQNDKTYRANTIRGATILYRDWSMLNRRRLVLRQKWADFFKDFDILLCPTAAITAFPHDHSYASDDLYQFKRRLKVNDQECVYADTLIPWAALPSLLHLPATTAPVGLAKSGLPVGVQIIGPYLEDRTPIHVAKMIEDKICVFSSPPGFDYKSSRKKSSSDWLS
ncbi:MAG: amidase [Desulfobacteraceae bacterium]|nr:amidase [Desulfobacteraceae bacterium]